MNRIPYLGVMALVALVMSSAVWGADSPQFRGPNRDGIFKDTGLLKTWPAEGPALEWKVDGVGQGYASVAVADGTIYVTGMQEDKQGYLFAYDLTGKQKWKVVYGPETLDAQAPGSRATPTVDGDRVYIMSGVGVLTCFAIADQKQVWQVDVFKQFNGQAVDWAVSESPLVDGDLIFATPGGAEASVVALNKMTGKTVWTSKGLGERSAYCSPVVFSFGGRRVLVTMTAKSVVGIDIKTGQVLWTHKHETEYDIHAVSPVCKDNVIYYTGGYGSGGGALEVSPDGSSVTPKWSDKNLDCQHHGVVLVDGYIYGTGHKNSKLMCLELASGKLMWTSDEVTQGDVVYGDGMLYVYEGPKKGIMSLVKAANAKFERAGSFQVSQAKDKHWAHPVIANGRLYVRHAGTLYAYKVAAK
ncbi:MAG: PQQ-like beta-propeller repeat protein [Candidatus Hydrogenedentes bacterium]|nr:PQQ-like beta-propeller repeat protein [Candidatus Hydrogenedentota bacterium]